MPVSHTETVHIDRIDWTGTAGDLDTRLHAGTVGFTADQSGGNVGVGKLVVQIDHIRHPAGKEELVSFQSPGSEHDPVDVPA